MAFDSDALVIGAGAAGASIAIRLAEAGWHVVIVEQHAYPRRKVCGECIAAGNLSLLDELGIGAEFRAAAGPELRRIGWMDAKSTACADMPPCTVGPYAYGRVLGRDRLDALLLQRARSLGVGVLQPMRARRVGGAAGRFECEVESPDRSIRTLRTPVVIDAHGSWERGPASSEGSAGAPPPGAPPTGGPATRKRNSDLFAFKANFRATRLAPGFLPVLALPGAYGGMVVGDDARTTVACCIRRDRLSSARVLLPGAGAGEAVEEFLRRTCRGVRDALDGASREGSWLSVGPLRPGVRVDEFTGVFRVGNAAGESHPLIGEGISMALQSSSLLAAALLRQPAVDMSGRRAEQVNAAYSAAWRRAFAPRLRLAAVYAHVAMRPVLAGAARAWLRHWPDTLRGGARLAGKATRAADPGTVTAEIA